MASLSVYLCSYIGDSQHDVPVYLCSYIGDSQHGVPVCLSL